MPAGRPSKMTNETLLKLKEAYLMSCSDEEACYFANIATSTLYRYQEMFPRFLDVKNRWKEAPTTKARAKIVKAIEKDDDNTTDAWKWIQAKKRSEFGQHQSISVSGQIDHVVAPAREQIERAMAAAGVIDVTPRIDGESE